MPTTFVTYMIVALVIIGIAAILLRFQRGLLGIILTALTAGLAFYWVRELNKTLRKGAWKDLLCELREEGDQLSLTAQVPGPESRVKVELVGRKLIVRGGMGFKKTVQLPFEAIIKDLRYVNGILNAKLEKKASATTAY